MCEHLYPFSGIVGQEHLKKALIYNAIEPKIGGVLLCGEKGTAKTTVSRALAQICSMKIINLPLNVTEDMLVGTIDFEQAIASGSRVFYKGILHRAHENILYVDEVNLLADNIVSILINVTSNAVNRVEREGIKHSHPCETVLIGSMNPEEGMLRPQLLDKFGLYVDVSGEEEVEKRMEIIRRRLSFEACPDKFVEGYEFETVQLKMKIKSAKTRIKHIMPSKEMIKLAAQISEEASCEGNRSEIILLNTARAIAAFSGRDYMILKDLNEAAEFVLPHRKREINRAQSSNPTETLDDAQNFDDTQFSNETQPSDTPQTSEGTPQNEETQIASEDLVSSSENGQSEPGSEQKSETGSESESVSTSDLVSATQKPYGIVPLFSQHMDRVYRQGTGRRQKTRTNAYKGRYVTWTESENYGRGIAFDATIRAAAPFQRFRERQDLAFVIEKSDYRFKKREIHIGASIVFLVDASGSMGAKKRMQETKEAVLSLLMDSYQKRDRVGFISFKGHSAEVLLDMTASAQMANKALQSLPTGGKTPLAAGLLSAWQLIKAAQVKEPHILPMLVLVTDGRTNVSLLGGDPIEDAMKMAALIASEKINTIVIDTENDFIKAGVARELSAKLNGSYYKMKDIRADQIQRYIKIQNPMLR